jgi:hypothetical protein
MAEIIEDFGRFRFLGPFGATQGLRQDFFSVQHAIGAAVQLPNAR